MAVTLPFVMLLLDWWPLKRFTIYDLRFTILRLVWEKIPFFALSAVSCWVTFLVQQKAGAVAALTRFSVSARMGNAFVSYARYLEKTFWPVSLATPYPYVEHWPWECIWSAVTLFVGLCVAAVWLGRKFPFGFTGWFWFVGTLVPVIGLVQVGGQSMSDRYGYVPLIGLFMVLAWGGGELWSRRCLPKPFLVLVVVLLLVASAWLTRIQVGYWQNTEMLFRHALAVTENNYTACVNLGTCLSARGDVQGAVNCYYQALRMNPSEPSVLYDLGNGFAKLGMWHESYGGEPCIFLPYEQANKKISQLWEEAVGFLRNAEKITFIGYSSPLYDQDAIKLFQSNVTRGIRIEVIDSSEATIDRFKKLFPNSVIEGTIRDLSI